MKGFINDFKKIVGNPLKSLFIGVNLVFMECILSIDNTAVLAGMLRTFKKEKDRKKAFRYGIIGAYLFRSIFLIFVTTLMAIWWIQPISGIYLIFLGGKNDPPPLPLKFYRSTVLNKVFSNFWKTVIFMEFVDLAFSMDNVFAAYACSGNLFLICLGIYSGILAIRFLAQFLIKLMEKYPYLRRSASLVIILLGFRLIFSFFWEKFFQRFFFFAKSSTYLDFFLSIANTIILFYPFFKLN
ncbi:MAG TPA: DUF475 domain-containing protein [Candidatus Angelobacter sp.]|jgi:YkoY family integral membrane protein|nr:DUF475 domain-containing protein [Candidatus Angelobacter sp.]